MNARTTPTVLITGASGHLGRAVASAFAAQGSQLVLLDREKQTAEVDGNHTENTVLHLPTDLLNPDQVRSATERALEQFGRIDVLVNAAGGFHMGEAAHDTPDSAWESMLDLNLRTALNTCRAVVPHMLTQGHGKIINVAAYAAQKGLAQMGAYCASKSALIRLTESLSAEVREQGINVNCVLPTILDTPPNRAAMPEADPARWVAPEALADVIVFLASEGARAIHGAALPVTGLSG